MLINTDWREDLRLLRLNNPSYRPLFILVDVLKWGLYLAGAALLVTFCWQLVSPHTSVKSSATLSNDRGSIVAAAPAESSMHSSETDSQSTEEISQARIDYLKNFATRVRVQEQAGAQATPASQADSAALNVLAEDDDVTVNAVARPDEIETIVIPATARADDSGIAKASTTNGNTIDTFNLAVPAPEVPAPAVPEPVVPEPAVPEVAALDLTASNSGNLSVDRSDSVDSGGAVAEVIDLKPEKQVSYTANSRAYQSSEWVLGQNGSHYTIQIGATVNRPFLLRFIDSLPDDQVVALFKYRINRLNKEEYVLSYGSFASYQLANLALDKLSQANRRYGAYPRSFNAIHDEMNKLKTVTAQASSDKGGDNSGTAQ